MRFTETPLEGAYLIDLEPHGDERGWFGRTFCAREFSKLGLGEVVAQGNLAFSPFKGTLRGLHYQTDPVPESKLVRCSRGSLFDVIIDLRPESPTYLQHFGARLTAESYQAIYVPAMFAHGFLTLEDRTETTYLVGGFYTPQFRHGIRYNDPAFDIKWPIEVSVLNERDASWPDFNPMV